MPDKQLALLQEKLATMATHAESAVTRAIRAAVERDDQIARAVQEDDSILDEFEKQVDELAIQLLAQTTVLSELRLITVAMKISHDLERVGDEATTIARRAIELNKEPALKTEVDLQGMAAMGLQMLKEAIDAFVRGDSSRARALIPRDKTIDSLNKQLQRELASYMVERPSTISRCLHLMTISKCLERIGDHATNIAEEAVYLLEGEDIRHNPQVRLAARPPS